MKPSRPLIAALILLPVLTNTAHGHLRWFTDGVETSSGQHFEIESTTLLIVLGAVLFALLAWLIERSSWAAGVGARLGALGRISKGLDWRFVAFLSGLMLIANAFMGVYLAPNLALPTALSPVGAIAQCVVGLLLMLQISYSISGVLVFTVAILTAFLVPPSLLVDYLFEFGALAIALILAGPTYCKLDRLLYRLLELDYEQLAHLPVQVLRLGVGLSLVVLAIHNKLVNPALTLAFLEEYHFNFMPYLGFENFSDLHFAFAAGVAELTLGLLVLFGIATRFVVAVLSVFFILTLILIGPIELVGHAPLIGIAVLLILRGSGRLPETVSLKEARRLPERV